MIQDCKVESRAEHTFGTLYYFSETDDNYKSMKYYYPKLIIGV